MDQVKAFCEWEATKDKMRIKSRIAEEMSTEIEPRLQAIAQHVLKGMARARQHKALDPTQIQMAQEALLDIVWAASKLSHIAWALNFDVRTYRRRLDELERHLSSTRRQATCEANGKRV
jgi:hypothetical protein